MSNEYRICSRCVMDTSASVITFDSKGICNYCTKYFEITSGLPHLDPKQKDISRENLVQRIRNDGRDKEYDCILGVSGGLDSSFALYTAKKLGLRPLAVHLDNGWDSELAQNNIEKLVTTLGVDLYTHVIDWEEFRDLQIAFFMSNVMDIEMLTDHALMALLYNMAHEKGIKYILTGVNFSNEGMIIPPGWNHLKIDLKNLKAIHKKFGNDRPIRTFPTMGIAKFLKYVFIDGLEEIPILDYVPFSKNESIAVLSSETGWKPYEKKHYESVFTRFYQGYILPKKFGIDKRRFHYSILICSGQMTWDEALKLLEEGTYSDNNLLVEDINYVLKKLGFTKEYFAEYLAAPPVPHSYYGSNEKYYNALLATYKRLKRK